MSDIAGLGEGIEAIRVLMQGTEIFLRFSGHAVGWTVDRITRASVLLAHHMQKKKSEMKEGEVNFRDLITKNNNGVSMMQMEYEHFDEFKKYVKDMGLSYSIMPDINKKDIYLEIAFPEEQGEAFRYFISQNPEFARTYTYGEYFDNANPVDMETEIRGFGKEAVAFAEQLKEKEQARTQGQTAPVYQPDPDYISVPFDPSLLKESAVEGQKMLAVPNAENEYIHIYDGQITELEGSYQLHLYASGSYFITDENEQAVLQEGVQKSITGADYNTAMLHMQQNTEINIKKREAAKGSVKFVKRDTTGKVQEKIVNPTGKKPVEELEEMLERAKGRGR